VKLGPAHPSRVKVDLQLRVNPEAGTTAVAAMAGAEEDENQLGLYKILFYFKAVVCESTILSFPPPTCSAHPAAILLHDYWTV